MQIILENAEQWTLPAAAAGGVSSGMLMAQTDGDRQRLPLVIQGGMGIGVSDWRLARAVAMAGQLGVVSGTALNTILVRRLQLGDADGSMRRALAACPLREAAQGIETRYFVAGGKTEERRHRLAPMFTALSPQELMELTVVANFAEVFLAKEGHAGAIGLNLLEKVQLPTLPSLFGAMLAGVDYVLMGAGIPRAIPGALDRMAKWEKASLKLNVDGALEGEETGVEFDPAAFAPEVRPALRRPAFLAIVSSAVLAMTLARKASGRVDGFVVEGLTAGGHNAPPRGGTQLNERGEPIYGPRDLPDLKAIRALGLPFWLAGSQATPEKLREAREAGAVGVQLGTAFAFCAESGLRADLKDEVIRRSVAGKIEVRTDPRTSPTGMPFKVVAVDGTVSDPAVYAARKRVCDLGYLREAYRKSDGAIGYRCPAEPEEAYVAKGGDRANTEGRKCLCNGLFSAVGLGQALGDGEVEPAIVTAGEDVADVGRFLAAGATSYSAAEVLRWVLG